MAAPSATLQPPVKIDDSSPRVLASGLSFEEFLEWDNDERSVEWINGDVVAKVTVSLQHNYIVGFLMPLLKHFVRVRQLGEVLFDPFVMKTGPDLPGRAPDIFFVAAANRHRLRSTYLDGPADLVVEVVSPGSTQTDREDKLLEYERGGVLEYWLIDLPRREARFYQRADDGFYRLAKVENGVFASRVLDGFRLQIDWLWQEPLPDPLAILKDWKLI